MPPNHMVTGFKHPLVAFREANGKAGRPMSQEEAAALVGITQSQWSRLESGEKVGPKIAKLVADLTGIDRDLLVNWGDNESGPPQGDPPKAG